MPAMPVSLPAGDYPITLGGAAQLWKVSSRERCGALDDCELLRLEDGSAEVRQLSEGGRGAGALQLRGEFSADAPTDLLLVLEESDGRASFRVERPSVHVQDLKRVRAETEMAKRPPKRQRVIPNKRERALRRAQKVLRSPPVAAALARWHASLRK